MQSNQYPRALDIARPLRAAGIQVAIGGFHGALKPIYNYLKDLPGLEATPPPILPKRFLTRTYNLTTSFDAGRGCPFECSF